MKTTLITVLALILIAGCQPRPTTRPAPALKPLPQPTVQFRQQLQERSAGGVVALVTAVLPDQHFAAISDVPANSFQVGDVVTFMAGDQTIVANGAVVAVTKDSAHVQFTPRVGGGPRVGDVAIKLK